MAQNAVADKPEVSEEPGERIVPPIPIRGFAWEWKGFSRGSATVVLPEGVTLQDIYDDPKLWKALQGNPNAALHQFDDLLVKSYDGSWFFRATVIEVTRDRVVLGKPYEKGEVPSRAEWEDANHRIAWEGSGYCVRRKLDGAQIVPGAHATVDAAKIALSKSFPVKAA